MQETVQKLLDSKKGILASDAREKSMGKRLEAAGVEATDENARRFREVLYTTPGIENFLSGVIMNDMTVRQTMQGKSPPQLLNEKGIVPGIKVDEGTESFNGTEEQITKGLEGLAERMKKYYEMGLRFAKWRAVIAISDIFPTDDFLDQNMDRMAEYAKICQDNGFVPIVEPEVLLDGNHTTTRCELVETKVIQVLFEKLKAKGIDLTKTILKPSMVLPGKDSGVKAAPLEVAQATLRTLKNSVPGEVPGIVFLSGGQTPEDATLNLNEINKLKGDAPWQFSFSFERALQGEAMESWAGKDENIPKAQESFLKRAEKVSLARQGNL